MKDTLSAGELARRIILQRFTETRNEYNEVEKTWSNLASRAAAYEPVSDGERSAASQVSAQASARFRIRWDRTVADLNPKDRVAFDGETYEILRVKEIGRRVGLEITGAARADDDNGEV